MASDLVRKRTPISPDDGRLKANRDKKKAGATVDRSSNLIEPLEWQKGLLSVPDDYDIILSGGRGGGKSTGMVLLILRDVMRFGKDFHGALVRKELAGLRKLETELTTLMNAIPQLRGSKYLTGQKEFRFSNGAILYAHYLKDLASFSRFQGTDLSHVYVDESGQLETPEALLRLRSSMRTTNPDIKPRMVLTANPNGAGAYWHLEHFINKLTPWQPGWCDLFKRNVVLIHSTLFDNSHLADREGYILQLKSSCGFDEARIQSEVYGSWNAISGAYFAGVFDENRIKVPAISQLADIANFSPKNVWLAMDWGCRRPACVLLAYKAPRPMNLPDGRIAGPGSIFLIDAIHTNLRNGDGTEMWNVGDSTLTTMKMADMVKDMCANYGLSLDAVSKRHRVADAAIGAEHGNDNGSIGAQLRKYGCEFIAAPKGQRPPGWTMVRQMMEASGDPSAPGLYATPRVKAFWATVPSLQCDSNRPEDIDSSQCDHLADALRYLITSVADKKYTGTIGQSSFRVW